MIEVQHLTRRYGARTAVDDLNFTVPDGGVYGFLGPNGAGKSTTMNMLTGCLAASEGHVIIDGHDIFDEPVQAKSHIGYLPELPPLYTGMTPREYLAFVARAKGLKPEELPEALQHVFEVTGITDVADRVIANLSKGYKQRVGIAQALLGDPDIIILDEPTVGLDPLQIVEIRDLIRELGKEHTVILSSHILSEVQAVCNQILMIARGKLVANDTPEALEAQFGGKTTYEMTVKCDSTAAQEAVAGLEGIFDIQAQDNAEKRCDLTIEVETDAEDMDEALSLCFVEKQIPVLRLEQKRASLEDVFLTLTAEAEEITAKEDAARKRFGKKRKKVEET